MTVPLKSIAGLLQKRSQGVEGVEETLMDWKNQINLEALEGWMDAQNLGRGRIEDPHLLTGGTQNYLLRFTRDNRDYVLRRPPKHLRKNSNETMLREARVLEALEGSKVPHPGFIAACADESIIGACFYLMEPVEGFNPAEGLLQFHQSDPDIRRRMGFAMVDAIVELSALDYKAVGLEGFGKPEGFLERQVPRWRAQLESYNEIKEWPGPEGLPGVEKIARWLEDNKPTDYRPGIFHGDFHLANVMFCNDSPELAALVDWELSSIGDPLIDLGWLIAGWPDPEDGNTLTNLVEPWDGFPTIEEMIERYGERSGRSLDAAPWFGVLGCFKLGVILEGTYARASAGKAPQETGDYLHGVTLNLFKRAQKVITNA